MMDYVRRTVRSEPGLSQEEALISLQEHKMFRPGTRIASFRLRQKQWVADLLEPKTAGPPPAFEEKGGPPEDEGPPSDSPPSDGPPEDEGPPSDDAAPDTDAPDAGGDEGGPPKEEKGDKKGSDAEIVHLLTAILHALGGGAPEGMGGPDALGPDLGGPAGPPPPPGPGHPPAGAGPPGAAKAPGAGRPMKPGEMPNKPGVTPVGAPAFASTKQSIPTGPVPGAGAPVGAGPTGPGGVGAGAGGGKCPTCGYPEPCPMHGAGAGGGQPQGMPAMAALSNEVATYSGKAGTITLTTSGHERIEDAVREAKTAVEPHGFKVRQAKRVQGGIAILASVR